MVKEARIFTLFHVWKVCKKKRITQTYNFLFSKQKHKSFNFWWRGAGGGVNFLLHKKIIHIHISVFYVFGHNIKSCSCFAVGAGRGVEKKSSPLQLDSYLLTPTNIARGQTQRPSLQPNFLILSLPPEKVFQRGAQSIFFGLKNTVFSSNNSRKGNDLSHLIFTLPAQYSCLFF